MPLFMHRGYTDTVNHQKYSSDTIGYIFEKSDFLACTLGHDYDPWSSYILNEINLKLSANDQFTFKNEAHLNRISCHFYPAILCLPKHFVEYGAIS